MLPRRFRAPAPATSTLRRRLDGRHVCSTPASSSSSTFGVVFDVDGVLVRGTTPVPGASDVLVELQATNTPFAILTNGGGYREQQKVKQLEQLLGPQVAISAARMCLSHTPMQRLVAQHGDELVLAVGKNCQELRHVMHDYGFQHVITVDQVHRHFPTMYPDVAVREPLEAYGRFKAQPFAAVFVLIDPIYWGRELQIVMDVLCAPRGYLRHDPVLDATLVDVESTTNKRTMTERQHVPLYSACADFQYVGDFHLPRYGAGAFHAVLEDLFTRTTGHKLEKTLFGKPQRTSFAFAETLIDAQHDSVERIYMVGDNPKTDIYGANQAGGRWKSVLTLTGMHAGPGNDDEHPAYQVVDDVVQALAFAKEDFGRYQREKSRK